MEKLVWLVEQAVVLPHMDFVEVCRFVEEVAKRHGYEVDTDLINELHNSYSDIVGYMPGGREASFKKDEKAIVLGAIPSALSRKVTAGG